jgi:hypothetical protein
MAKRPARPKVSEQDLARARAELYGESSGVTFVPLSDAPATILSGESVPKTRRPHTHMVTVDDLRQEYKYLITDLRNMGLLALFLIVGLVVTALVIL